MASGFGRNKEEGWREQEVPLLGLLCCMVAPSKRVKAFPEQKARRAPLLAVLCFGAGLPRQATP